jgi:hypothetical protein
MRRSSQVRVSGARRRRRRGAARSRENFAGGARAGARHAGGQGLQRVHGERVHGDAQRAGVRLRGSAAPAGEPLLRGRAKLRNRVSGGCSSPDARSSGGPRRRKQAAGPTRVVARAAAKATALQPGESSPHPLPAFKRSQKKKQQQAPLSQARSQAGGEGDAGSSDDIAPAASCRCSIGIGGRGPSRPLPPLPVRSERGAACAVPL